MSNSTETSCYYIPERVRKNGKIGERIVAFYKPSETNPSAVVFHHVNCETWGAGQLWENPTIVHIIPYSQKDEAKTLSIIDERWPNIPMRRCTHRYR